MSLDGVGLQHGQTEESKEKFIDAYERSAGNITYACKAVGMARQTFYLWLEKDFEFAEKVDNLRESQIDMAEHYLKREMQGGNITAIIFFLKTKGRGRGYIEHGWRTGEPEVDVDDETLRRFAQTIITPETKSIDSAERAEHP